MEFIYVNLLLIFDNPITFAFQHSPAVIKNGMRNFPLNTRDLNVCRVVPSNGKEPETKTYKTTPRL